MKSILPLLMIASVLACFVTAGSRVNNKTSPNIRDAEDQLLLLAGLSADNAPACKEIYLELFEMFARNAPHFPEEIIKYGRQALAWGASGHTAVRIHVFMAESFETLLEPAKRDPAQAERHYLLGLATIVSTTGIELEKVDVPGVDLFHFTGSEEHQKRGRRLREEQIVKREAALEIEGLLYYKRPLIDRLCWRYETIAALETKVNEVVEDKHVATKMVELLSGRMKRSR